jgi:hypothetical protein
MLYDPIRTAEVDDCLRVVDRRPRYNSPIPRSPTITRRACRPLLNLLGVERASSILYGRQPTYLQDVDCVTHSAVFSRSVGVTTVTLSTAPATMPAKMARAGDSLPSESARAFLIASNERNLTPALQAVP